MPNLNLNKENKANKANKANKYWLVY